MSTTTWAVEDSAVLHRVSDWGEPSLSAGAGSALAFSVTL